MKKFALLISLIASTMTGVSTASAAQECLALNAPYVADDGATVSVTSISIAEKAGSNQLTISYVLLNATPDKKLDEGSFKIFFSNGESIPQYGGFGYLFPTDTKTRSHTWEYLKSQVPTVIEYNAGFFTAKPSALKLNWVAPGGVCDLGTPIAASPKPSPMSSSSPAPVAAPVTSSLVSEVNSDLTTLRNRMLLTMKMNPKLIKEIQPLLTRLTAAENPTDADAATKMKIIITLDATLTSILTKSTQQVKTSITCIKGKSKKLVTAVNPKCPAGYSISKK